MSEMTVETGKKLRAARKARSLTLEALSSLVGKSKSVLSKYEKGEISVDIDTLGDLARALRVDVTQILFSPSIPRDEETGNVPTFFSGRTRFYSYVFDGRNNRVLRCVFDVLAPLGPGRSRVIVYMNFADYADYQKCENTYQGLIEHYDAVTNIRLTNRDSPMERAGAQILASFLDSDTKWGLWQGLSTRPMMPIATKMLFAKNPLKEDDALVKLLKINREDIRLLKLYNMLPVV